MSIGRQGPKTQICPLGNFPLAGSFGKWSISEVAAAGSASGSTELGLGSCWLSSKIPLSS